METMKCPICDGSGKLQMPERKPFTKTEVDLSAIAKRLRQEGYSFREITSIMGFKHPGSISYILNQ